jgi:phosphatidylglycerophosphate synthase
METENRRQVSSRNVSLFHDLARTLIKFRLTPNKVSVASAGFALFGGLCIFMTSKAVDTQYWLFLMGALFGIQMRLVCNLVDGLMAVEGGLKTPAGELYNDMPDRFSDIFLIAAVGYAMPQSWGADLAWIAVVLAILTAYVRVLGASMGTPHFFLGPMAKQHRMALLNLILIVGAVEKYFGSQKYLAYTVGLLLIAIGSLFTIANRVNHIKKRLE